MVPVPLFGSSVLVGVAVAHLGYIMFLCKFGIVLSIGFFGYVLDGGTLVFFFSLVCSKGIPHPPFLQNAADFAVDCIVLYCSGVAPLGLKECCCCFISE